MSSNLAHGDMYSIHHYVITFVGELWQVDGFVPDPSTNETDHHDKTEILLN